MDLFFHPHQCAEIQAGVLRWTLQETNSSAYFSEHGCSRTPRRFQRRRWGQQKLPRRCQWSLPLAATLQRAIRERRTAAITRCERFKREMAEHTQRASHTRIRAGSLQGQRAWRRGRRRRNTHWTPTGVCNCLACVIILLKHSITFKLLSFRLMTESTEGF